MLLEEQVNFNVVNTLEDWSDLEVIIITSGGILEKDLPRISAFLNRGGKILAMGEGVFSEGKPVFDMGADYIGKARFDVDYTVVREAIGEGIVPSPFLNYSPALRVRPYKSTEILATIREPYFSRTIKHYCSHKNTPYTLEDATHPAVIRTKNVVYIAHDLDVQYYREGARLHRDLFMNALKLIRQNPFVTAALPSMGRMNLLHQPEQKRYVVHLLYASPIQRGAVRVVEDLLPLYNIPVSVDFPREITRAYLIPSGKVIKTTRRGGKTEVVIPELLCHNAVVFEYK
jgi:hypothetical protein